MKNQPWPEGEDEEGTLSLMVWEGLCSPAELPRGVTSSAFPAGEGDSVPVPR